MQYIRTHFRIDLCEEWRCELLSAIASGHGYEGFEYTTDGITGYIPAPLYEEGVVDTILSSLPMEDCSISHSSGPLADINWNAAWEEHGFEPIVVSEECIVVDARHLPEPDIMCRYPVCISIRATQSFGTGTHATTQMMLRKLMKADLNGKCVIDCGCGTGILAIAAVLRGAQRAIAFDIDAWSTDTTRHNARINGVEIDIRQGGCEMIKSDTGTADMLVANINRNIIINDLACYAAAVGDGGTLLLSGFLKEDEPIIARHARKAGLQPVETVQESDWILMQLVKHIR